MPHRPVSQFVTRAEAAMILLQSRLPVIPTVRGNGLYPDVPRDAWYERYVVLAARYGILNPEVHTNQLYPMVPVNRAAFVKMLAQTFNLPRQFPKGYRDVQNRMWFATYAGIAQNYGLFPHDRDQTLFNPGNLLTASEVALALQIVVQSHDRSLAPLEEVAQTQTPGDEISTHQESVTLVVSPTATSPVPLSSAGTMLPPPLQGVPLQSRDVLRVQVLQLVNAERTRRGLRTLRTNLALQGSAQQYADTMAVGNFFGHTSPTGQRFRERIESSGFLKTAKQETCFCVRRVVLGENLGHGQTTAADIVRDWMNSPAHKAALLSSSFTDTGIGITGGLWVEHFGGVEQVQEN